MKGYHLLVFLCLAVLSHLLNVVISYLTGLLAYLTLPSESKLAGSIPDRRQICVHEMSVDFGLDWG